MSGQAQNNNVSDHDLLIELRTEMRAVRGDIKDLRDNTSKRVDFLESNKFDKSEANRLIKEADETHSDHEKRIRSVELFQQNLMGRYVVLGVLGVAFLSAVVSFFVDKLD